MDLTELLAVARGDRPADLLLSGGRLVNVLSGEIVRTDIAGHGSRIAGLGSGYEAREVVDISDRYVCPGLIDAHVHVESAMVPPSEFAAVVVPRGVTAVVTDPHEIANVLGLEGIRYMLRNAEAGPLAVYANASSCVPATDLATSGAVLPAEELEKLLDEPRILGLAEVMNFPGVIHGDPAVLAKIAAFQGRPIDGHGPGLEGQQLNAYLAAGIRSDHECTSADEARRKARLGMTVFIREGSAAHDLESLLPAVDARNERRFCFCTDDRSISALIEEGSIDHVVRTAVAKGLEPITAIRMATLNTAAHFGLHDRGAVAPGWRADLVLLSDLHDLRAEQVYVGGRLVALDGVLLEPPRAALRSPGSPMQVDWSKVRFGIPAKGSRVHAIGSVPGQLLTEDLVVECRVVNGEAHANPERGLLKMAVIERYGKTGNVGLGFAKGIGLQRGAIAGTVAHDHHNLVVIGVDDDSMMTAARAVADGGGGLAAAAGDRVLATMQLAIAGLMSDRPHREVAGDLERVNAAARELGSPLDDPFMTMSFLALEVIPALKLTDRGLVDVNSMSFIPLFV
jgi:adenine deaminase